jgi:hypothetical protein
MTGTGTRVLYIGGLGRSGSTVLELMLSQVPGVCAVGELRHLWQRGLVDNVLCGCRTRFSECPFWTAVGECAFGSWDQIDAREVLELDAGLDRHRYIPSLIAPRGDFAVRLRRYAELLTRLYTAISEVTGCRVVVDSSKDPPFAYILRKVPGIDLRLAHLVRDSRGAAFSWTRKRVRPEVVDRETYMHTYRPATMAMQWLDYNMLFHALGRLGVPRQLMFYEAMIAAPEAHLRRVLRHVDESIEGLPPIVGAGHLRLEHTTHSISGNPVRFTDNAIPLRLDDEWRHAMPAHEQAAVLGLTWPLLLAYGYLSPPARRRAQWHIR